MLSFLHNEIITSAFPGGVGIIAAGAIGWMIKTWFERRNAKSKEKEPKDVGLVQTINVTQTNHTMPDVSAEKSIMNEKDKLPIEVRRERTNILFIDDKKFDVVDILVNSGWKNTSWIKDAKSLNQKEILNADIIFVDIQGVGIKMRFSEEGLGLAKALKEKYKDKKIVIYSAEQTGNRFHEALRLVDDSLDKDSDPYIFEDIVEKLS
ncbi:hypothetical protein [Serratia marcescens]|uniref:hypothetical protein n=1 Tax=Serratia marcescens TaxID=615 RepID=UPI001D5F566F|nr:hypothetical protein [Serratia marcescens]CAF2518279.1 hypothetical protein AI2857V1_0411 [Serratia marcescens]CAH5069878.1 hypothetical protein AI2857V1_0411 [Serratia marcescens]